MRRCERCGYNVVKRLECQSCGHWQTGRDTDF